MRRILVLLLLFFFCSSTVLQAQRETKLKTKAVKHYNAGNKIKALKVFKKLFKDYPNSDSYPQTFFNIAVCYAEIDSLDQAMNWYLKILDADIQDNQEDYNFPDTHTNIKHKSAFRIANIYYNRGDTQLALDYYFIALTKYPYFSSSGTSKKKNDIQVKDYIVDCYLKLNRVDDAVLLLLPEALTSSPWQKNPVSEYLIQIIDKHYDKSTFTNELKQALQNIEQEGDNYVIQFWEVKVKIIPYLSYYPNKEVFRAEVMKREFMKSLEK